MTRRTLAGLLSAGTLAAQVRQNELRLARGIHVGAGEDRFGEHFLLAGATPRDTKVSAQDTGGDLLIAESITPPNNKPLWAGPPLHVHLEQDEWCWDTATLLPRSTEQFRAALRARVRRAQS